MVASRFCLIILFLGTIAGCSVPVEGCTDPSAANYNPEAGKDDGSCQYVVPERYYFERRDRQTLSYGQETVRQLLINDLDLLIASLAEPGALPVAQEQLLQYYDHQDAFNLYIATPVGSGLQPADSTFRAIATNTRLSDRVKDLPPVATPSQEVQDWTAFIASQSQGSGLGSPEVYTTSEGLDLREMLRITLLGAVLYAQAADSLLKEVDTLNNVTFRSGCTCTDMENALDRAFGNFGAAQDYRAFSLEDLSGGPDGAGKLPFVKDRDSDGAIDYGSEYNHLFARLAGQRDLASGGETRFSAEIFDAFLEARAAATIGPGQEPFIRQQADLILQSWDRLLAATVVHHLNEVIAMMAQNGTPDYDRPTHNRAWADMYAFTRILAFNPYCRAGTPNELYTQFLVPMGTAPVYARPGDPDYESYRLTLLTLRSELGSLYDFSQELMEKW